MCCGEEGLLAKHPTLRMMWREVGQGQKAGKRTRGSLAGGAEEGEAHAGAA
jgi:hypothetical protein